MDGLTTRAFHQGSPQLRAYVVAECVERPAQFFTGTRGADPSRADDVATVVEALDALWDFSAEPQVFAPLVERVCRFEELVITETPDYVAETLEEGAVMFTLVAFKESLTYRYEGESHMGLSSIAYGELIAYFLDKRFPGEGIYAKEAKHVNGHCRHRISPLNPWNAPGWQPDRSATSACNSSWGVLRPGHPGDRISRTVDEISMDERERSVSAP